MASKIEWLNAPGYTGETWNPTTGCNKVSAGCKNCWAAGQFPRRYKRDGREFGDVAFHPERLAQPLRWRKPRMVAVSLMGDLLHDRVADKSIAEVFGVMAVAGGGFQNLKPYKVKEPPSERYPNGVTVIKHRGAGVKYGPHRFLVLTKRARRLQRLLGSPAFREAVSSAAFRWAHDRVDAGYLSDRISARNRPWAPGRAGRLWPLPNVLIGVSIEDQQTADERIPLLLQTPAVARFVSAEPLLGPVDFSKWVWGDRCPDWQCGDSTWDHECGLGEQLLHQIIVGGESGSKARPMHPDWARQIRNQCTSSGVSFFMKQMTRKAPIPEDLRVREWPSLEVGR